MVTRVLVFLALLDSAVVKLKVTTVENYVARIMGAVWNHQVATCTVSASQVSVEHTARMSRGAPGPAKMEELV